MADAWLVLAVGDDRSHGGNDGYDDEPSQHYSWDSTVPNHAKLTTGDVIALWDKKSLLGISVIEDIHVDDTVKDLYSCPHCGKADFKPRKTKLPKYLCRCDKVFDEPNSRREQVRTYRSRHGAAWVDMPGLLPGAVLRSLCDSPKSQLSMRPLRWEKLRAAINATGAPTTVDIADTAQKLAAAGGHRKATVRVRVGQSVFRKRLLDEQGEICAFTGPAPAAALEAAHLYSYAATGQHFTSGGLLLRRDVHRLFDLGLIAVRPGKQTLDIAEQLAGYPVYRQLHDRSLTVQLRLQQRDWLAAHWDMHRIQA